MKRAHSPSAQSSKKTRNEEVPEETNDSKRAAVLRVEMDEIEKKMAQFEQQKDKLSNRIRELESLARSATQFAPYKGERQRASFLARHETQISKFRDKLSTTEESCIKLQEELCMKRNELQRIAIADKA